MNIISKYEQKEIVIFLDEKINQNNEDKLFNKLKIHKVLKLDYNGCKLENNFKIHEYQIKYLEKL
jgi:hypothetical protein